jgi:hypothetical protein
MTPLEWFFVATAIISIGIGLVGLYLAIRKKKLVIESPDGNIRTIILASFVGLVASVAALTLMNAQETLPPLPPPAHDVFYIIPFIPFIIPWWAQTLLLVLFTVYVFRSWRRG